MTESARQIADLTDSVLKAVRAGKSYPRDVDGMINMSGCKEARLTFRDLHFKHGFVADSANIANLIFEDCVFDAPLKMRNARIGGDLSLHNCRLSALPASGAKEPRAIDLRGTSIYGSLDVYESRLCGACRFDRIVVRGNVRIREGSGVTGTISFTGAAVDSELEISGSTLREIVFNGTSLGALWIGSRGAVACTGLYATDSKIRTFARMTRLTVSASTDAKDSGRSRRLHLEEPGTVAFRNCHFGSLFSTWIVKRYGEDEEDGWQPDNRVVAETAFLLTDCTIEGELTLTRLQVGRNAMAEPAPARPDAKSWGSVRLDRTRVGGAFLVLSPISVATRFELSAHARQKALALVKARRAMAREFRAHMRSLSMRDFQASYVDLSGLQLHSCGRDDLDGPNDGCLVADRLVVKSSLTTYAWASELERRTAGRRAYTHVPGAMRLRGAEIGELRLAAESFGKKGHKAWTDGVVLELARIRQLRVPPREETSPPREETSPSGGKAGETPHANAFPVPLDLSGLTVSNWNFDEDVHAEGTGDVDHYLDFLDNDETLHREVYRSVAASLRNVGRDADAEKIVYTEESRARWEGHHPGASWPPYPRAGRPRQFPPRPSAWLRALWPPRPFEWADRWLLRYRRNPIRLLYVILGLFVVSLLFVSSRPANFELSNGTRLVLGSAPPGSGYAAGIDARLSGRNLGPRHWGLWNAVWMSARYHIPIVPMLVEDEYVASNDNQLDFGLPLLVETAGWKAPDQDPGSVWLTAEDWFAVMSLLNWIMWPLLLTFALRRALRAEEPGS
jgi:hypothetical protein